MEAKMLKTVISAEEEHLASKSKKISKNVKKVVCETNTMIEKTFTDLKQSTSTTAEEKDIRAEIESGVVADNLKVNDANYIVMKKGKSKKSKKQDHDTKNISVKSSFNKFDALQKRSLIHVRSSDSSKAQEIFSNPQNEQQTNCKLCNKPVYKMEEIIVQFKGDKGIYHKFCMRCKDCAKQLKFDNYQSHEGNLYCSVHFKL